MFSTLNVNILTRLHNNYQYMYLYYIDALETTTGKIRLTNKNFNSYIPKTLMKNTETCYPNKLI